jgi:hypothetical protein
VRLWDWRLDYYCWYQCASNQYMSSHGSCITCSEWQTGDASTAVTANNITNAIKCAAIDCWVWAWYSFIVHGCLGDSASWGSCPDSSWTLCDSKDKCIKCIDSSLTPNASTCKCG